MSSLSELVYAPLQEENKPLVGWSKHTIEWAVSHKRKVNTIIRGILKKYNKVASHTDVDDIYSELLHYLYKSNDYDIDVACERSSSADSIISLEGYVRSCIKYCTIRYATKLCEENKHIQRDTIKVSDDDKEYSIFDTIPDDKSAIALDRTMYDLDEVCRHFEYQRYHLGLDVFQLWFIRLKTLQLDKKDEYENIIKVLGVTKREMKRIEDNAYRDGIMLNIAKAITVLGDVEEALNILRRYVYSADKIEKVIEQI